MSQSAQASVLPRLREDLSILTGPVSAAGARSWIIYDPARHSYIQIDRRSYELISLWPSCVDPGELIRRAKAAFGFSVSDKELGKLVEFASSNQLTVEQGEGGWKSIWARKQKARHSVLMTLVHSYLFFRIPLFRPEPFLNATLLWVAPLFTRVAFVIISLVGIFGLYLVSRQWAAFADQFTAFVSFDGAISFAVTLFCVKALHELGHAYTAFRFGCRVPTMGLAFMMMAPMLYTDVSDAWQIPSRRRRVLIGAAGVIVELALACIATLGWALLPPGTAKSIAFSIATVGWVLSLAMNLNPLMRFDGYYIFSDLLGIENLQERSFALGSWKMREVLFGLRAPCPEVLAPKMERTLVAYAWAVWVYRALLFTGIAIIVYAFFFKVLGIVLFGIEIVYFVAGPVWRELGVWNKMRLAILGSRRTIVTGGVTLALLLAFVVPWSTRIDVPAVLENADLVRIYPPRPAEISAIRVAEGDRVAAGDVLFELRSPETVKDKVLTEIRIALTKFRLARGAADQDDRDESMILARELVSLESKRDGLAREQAELTVRAPAAGVILELNPALHPGRWIGKAEPLALVGDSGTQSVKGYVAEADLWRVSPGANGRFIPDDVGQPPVAVRLVDVAESGAAAVDILELASRYGGRVDAESEAGKRLIPKTAQYPVKLAATDLSLDVRQSVRGLVHLDGLPESIFARLCRHAAGVLVRESGF